MSALIKVEDLSVELPIYGIHGRSLKKALVNMGAGSRLMRHGGNQIRVHALNNLSFALNHGDRLAVIGHNGAGKTTLLRVLAGVFEPTAGAVTVEGRTAPLFDTTLGMDLEATGHENIRLRGLLLGLHPADIKARTAEIGDFTELGDYLSMPVRTYSSGMLLRLGFAITTAIQPEVLLMDEWIAAVDPDFLIKAEKRIRGIIDQSSIVVLASHNHHLLRRMCTKALVLDHGSIRYFGPLEGAEERHLLT
jgi:ABC-type polysaccharide/polyol phosphate transport system ATPase subunit